MILRIMQKFLSFFILINIILNIGINAEFDYDIKVFTVASDQTDGYERYLRSANYYDIEVETLGLGQPWLGGDMNYAGGGYKVNLLKNALKPLKDSKSIVLVTDSYDAIFLSRIDEIIKKFKDSKANILFSAEHYCYPDASVKHLYPAVGENEAQFLNSGMFMGYASDIYEMLKTPIKNRDDDQLYYTTAFLNKDLREKLNMKLDTKSEIFQNLFAATAELKLIKDDDSGLTYIKNIVTNSIPNILHGNGVSKIIFNNYAGYLAGARLNDKCMICEENNIKLEDNELPIVTLGLFIEKPVPFLEEFFDDILTLDYPKDRINFFIHNSHTYHSKIVQKFINHFSKEYKNMKFILDNDGITEAEARNLAVSHSKIKESDYLFVVDGDARIDNPLLLKELIKFNRTVISPVLVRYGEVWSNFWGSLSDEGFYERSHDYMDIAKNRIRGMWNVPFLSSCYLIKKLAFDKIKYDHDVFDPDMAMCKSLRDNNIFMYVVNVEDYGHLINGENFNILLARPDFYMLESNQLDWERRYIHPDFIKQFEPNATAAQPCPDVYWFKIATEQFCSDLIAIAENFGKWSDGTNKDERLQGGYEAVPTRDIHMNQVGLDPLWLHFLKLYVRPLQELAFTGYYHNPPRSLMNFIVRYRPDEQPSLRPHHDSSTYTINIALNRAGIDYQGGGCKFLRYNCSVTDTKIGWMLMHPGRLTHFHEGLLTTNGTRYIMISFIDP